MQYVIYGANGWIGRSAVSVLLSVFEVPKSEILLIGSVDSRILIEGKFYRVFSQSSSLDKIRHGAIFFNSAFLRREKILELGVKKYLSANNRISTFAENIIMTKNLKSFINISSGAARYFDQDGIQPNFDHYGYLKNKWEKKFRLISNKFGSQIINCRVFSVTGKHINEYKNLAISTFIQQAIRYNKIDVKSPGTLRTFIDAEDLSSVLFNMCAKEINFSIDSGGELISLEKLARIIANQFSISTSEISYGHLAEPDYFGDFNQFNQIAGELEVNYLKMEGQVRKTLEAFIT